MQRQITPISLVFVIHAEWNVWYSGVAVRAIPPSELEFSVDISQLTSPLLLRKVYPFFDKQSNNV